MDTEPLELNTDEYFDQIIADLDADAARSRVVISPQSIAHLLMVAVTTTKTPSQRGLMKPLEQRIAHECAFGKCNQLPLVNVINVGECAEFARVLYEDSAIRVEPVFDPERAYICEYGVLHYCGTRCSSLVGEGGYYTCWKSGRVKDPVMLSIDTSTVSDSNTFTTDDGTKHSMVNPGDMEQCIQNAVNRQETAGLIIPTRKATPSATTPSLYQNCTTRRRPTTRPPHRRGRPFSLASGQRVSTISEEEISHGQVYNVTSHTTKMLPFSQVPSSSRSSDMNVVQCGDGMAGDADLSPADKEWVQQLATELGRGTVDFASVITDYIAIRDEIISTAPCNCESEWMTSCLKACIPVIFRGYILIKFTMQIDEAKNVLISDIIQCRPGGVSPTPSPAMAAAAAVSPMSPRAPQLGHQVAHFVLTYRQCATGLMRTHIAGYSVYCHLINLGVGAAILSEFETRLGASGAGKMFRGQSVCYMESNTVIGKLFGDKFGSKARNMSRGANTTSDTTVIQMRFAAITNWMMARAIHRCLVEQMSPEAAMAEFDKFTSLVVLDR